MARGRSITKDVRNRVERLYYNHPSCTTAQIRDKVNKQLREEGITNNKNWLGLSAVQKIIKSVRRGEFLDETWTVQSLAKSEIPPGALPLVLDAYALTVAWGLEKSLTVREAKWVGRLYHVLTDVEELTIAARECALDEVTSEPTGIVNADFVTRAITGKPGVTYKYLGNGDFQMILHQRGVYELDIKPQTPQDNNPLDKLQE